MFFKKNTTTILFTTMLFCLSCGSATQEDAVVNNIPFNELLQQSRNMILNGSWSQAEERWMVLSRKLDTNKLNEIEAWVDFQMDILSATRGDKLKLSIRQMSMQHLHVFYEVSIKYNDWIIMNVSLFEDDIIKHHASETLKKHDLIIGNFGKRPTVQEVWDKREGLKEQGTYLRY